MTLAEEGFEGSELFDLMKEIVDSDEELKKKSLKTVNAIVLLTLKNKQGKTKSWIMDFKKDGTVAKVDGSAPKTDISLAMADKDFIKLVNNKANAQRLYMNGKLKVKGNLMKAASIETFLKKVDPRAKL
ncbi:uncharacterized protein PRCAT00003547001 [Priceomyces carsonii]|uniref:uncharacterized protein n=1 Tax=Priceomyces carsonii TaxID=28549 RepID=UPI002EDB9D0A|nr:unnamed protein product [Priceomyces carsonii]